MGVHDVNMFDYRDMSVRGIARRTDGLPALVPDRRWTRERESPDPRRVRHERR